MAYFAKINSNGIVIQVKSIANEVLEDSNGNEIEQKGIDFLNNLRGQANWVQCSYNKTFRKNYPGVGFTYDSTRDAFIPPKPYNSWVLNETTCRWEAPVPMPTDGVYNWDDANQQWVLAKAFVTPSNV
jgi:hypothetical protein